MAQPVVSALAQRIYNYLSAYTYADEANGWPLLRWATGWAGMVQDVYDTVKTRNGKSGWSAVTDPDQAIAVTMPFLAQMLGIRLSPGETTEEWRNTIKDAAGLYAGTPSSIAGEVQKRASVRTVLIFERDTSNYHFSIGAFSQETFERHIGFETDAELEDWDDPHLFPFRSTVTRISDPSSAEGYSFMQVEYPTTSSTGIRRVYLVDVAPGDEVTASIKVRVRSGFPDALMRFRLGDADIGEYTTLTPSAIVAGTGWQEFSLTYTCGSGTQSDLQVICRDTNPRTVDVDDINITSTVLQSTLVSTGSLMSAVKVQKPIGLRFATYVIDLGDWTWFVIGATRYERNLAGFIEVVPSPYATWQDVIDNFATWQDFIDNTPI